MAVPNTNTFTLQDVENEIAGTQGGLTALFAASVDGSFDPAYKGSKDRLSNFRNYGATPSVSIRGFLYNWAVASDANLMPTGWHVPTLTEWQALETYLATAQGGKLKETGLTYWNSPNQGATNSAGFYGRGAGERQNGGTFINLNQLGTHWANTQNDANTAWVMALDYLVDYMAIGNRNKRFGCSIRGVKDNSTNPGTVTDIDGNIYNCVTIGTQVWMVQNLKTTRLNNGTSISLITDATAWSTAGAARCAYNNDLNNV